MDIQTAATGGANAPVDMRDPAFRDDPHALLRRVRESGRVMRDVVGVWLVTHYADVSSGLRNSHLSREPWRSPMYRQTRPFIAESMLERTVEQWMLFNDPPKHTRLRRLVNGAFKPPVIAALRERITAVTDELLSALPEVAAGTAPDPAPDPAANPAAEPRADFDLMRQFAQPLPVRVICDVLGLPAEDFAQTKQWSDALALIVEPVVRREQRVAANQAAEEMVAYLRGHIARRRCGARDDDLLSLLVAAQDEEGQLTEDELLGNLILLFIAGHETTTNLIGNGMLTLLRHPSELARLRADLSLVPGAVEEALRYEGSVNMISRLTVEPYAVGDTVIPPEQIIFFMLGPANRDPAAFTEPERFDIGRTHNPHLAFGAGIHFCLGAPLARLEAEIAFGRLLRRFPFLALAEDTPRWRKLINLRGLESLRLVSSAALASADNAH